MTRPGKVTEFGPPKTKASNRTISLPAARAAGLPTGTGMHLVV